MKDRQACYRAFATCALLAVVESTAAGAGEIWHNDWIVQAQPSFHVYSTDPGFPWTSFGFGTGGDLLLAGSRSSYSTPGLGYEFDAVSATGALRWTANFSDGPEFSGVWAVRPDEAGGYLIGFPGDYGDRVAHFDVSGSVKWSRYVDAHWLAMPAANRVAALGCTHLTLIDDADGRVIWEHAFNAPRYFDHCEGGLVTDADGNLYAGVQVDPPAGTPSTGFRTVKLDAQGSVLWDVSTPDAPLTKVIGLGTSNLFALTTTDLRAQRLTDGSTAWVVPQSSRADVLMSGDGASEPIVFDGDSVRRVDGATGAIRWNQSVPGLTGASGIVGDSVVAAANGGIVKINLASGAIGWTVATPMTPWAAFGSLAGTSFIGIVQEDAQISASVKRIAYSNGTVTDFALPQVAAGIDANTAVDGGGKIVSVGMVAQPDHAELHLRRVDAETGVTLWHAAEIDLCCVDWSLQPPSFATGPDAVAVTLSTATTCDDDQFAYGFAEISLRELATGQLRWRVSPTQNQQGCVQMSAPIVDGNGDVYASMGSTIQSFDSGGQELVAHQTLFKFAAQTGNLLWSLDQQVPGSFVAQPQSISLVGSDVLLQGPFRNSQDTIRRVSGVDGSTLWSSGLFHENGIYDPARLIDAHHVALFSANETNVLWAGIDTDTGQTQWTASTPIVPCVPYAGCTIGGSESLQASGDTLSGGEKDFAPLLVRYRNDGSGLADRWVPGSGNPTIRGAVVDLWNGPSATIGTTLYRGFSLSQGSLRFLSTFDTTTGTLGSKQTLYSSTPAAPWRLPTTLKATSDHRLLARTFGQAQGEPPTSGAVLFDTSLTTHGNLSVTLTTDSVHVQPGQTVGFHLTVSFIGDAPLAGAKLAAVIPWQGGIDQTTCSGTNCSVDTSRGDVDATFDIPAGGSVEITGTLRVLDQTAHPSMSAHVWGPIGLGEDDVTDNFAQLTPLQSLFADGFDN